MTIVEDPTTATGVIGSRVLRKEAPVLLTGEAVFTNDMSVPGALYMAVLRSPYAHASIVSIDASAATAMPGVRAVYTGADLGDLWAAPMPCAWPVTEDMLNPPHHPIATDAVNFVGDGVAVVLADSDAIAHDAIEVIDVTFDPLEAVTDLEDALSDRVLVHPELGTNSSYTWNLLVEETDGAVQQAFDRAAYTVRERYVQQRLIPMAMEPRAVVAVPQPFGGDITLYTSTQIPHVLKVMVAVTLGVPEHQLRVVAPAVGGGFGAKLDVYAEELLCVALARKLATPCGGTKPARRTPSPASRVGARSSTSSWPPTPTARSPPCGCGSPPTWAPTYS
jgi:carbon-monoxide dehydrogenase large subunit